MRKKNIVTYQLDVNGLSSLTAAQRAELEALAALPEDRIDTSDIAPASDAFLANAVRNPFGRHRKEQRARQKGLGSQVAARFAKVRLRDHEDIPEQRGYPARPANFDSEGD